MAPPDIFFFFKPILSCFGDFPPSPETVETDQINQTIIVVPFHF